jgi:hypothetical protein
MNMNPLSIKLKIIAGYLQTDFPHAYFDVTLVDRSCQGHLQIPPRCDVDIEGRVSTFSSLSGNIVSVSNIICDDDNIFWYIKHCDRIFVEEDNLIHLTVANRSDSFQFIREGSVIGKARIV